MGALGTRPLFSGIEAWVSGCGFSQLPNHLTTEPPNQWLGTRPQISGVRHIAAKINRARTRRMRREREEARPMWRMHFHGWNYIKKSVCAASAIYPSHSLSLAPTRMRREAMHLDNAREFHSKSTVAVPEVRAAMLRRPCYIVCASHRNYRLATLLPYRFDKGPSACSPRTPTTVVIYSGNQVRPCSPQ